MVYEPLYHALHIWSTGSKLRFFFAKDRMAPKQIRGGEWYLEKRGSRKILAGSRNLGSVFEKSRSLVFAWFVFTFFESRNFLPKSLGLGFLTRISMSRRVSDFTISHPSNRFNSFLRILENAVSSEKKNKTKQKNPQELV